MQRLALLIFFSCIFVLTACGGGSSNEPSQPILQPIQKSINLQWVAPSNRLDGEPLSSNEILGYKIYMGTDQSDLSLIGTIDDPQILTYKVSDLSSGTYYFAISVFASDGLESPKSEAILKRI